jgi:hypothetical protein
LVFTQVDVLSRVSHRNLVSLIGYCHEDNQQMLIYEFMHKGSLRDHLYGTINSYPTFDFEHLIDPQALIHIKNTSLIIIQLVLIILLTFVIGIMVSVFWIKFYRILTFTKNKSMKQIAKICQISKMIFFQITKFV